ncbi:MAG TPA: AAA family ATPase, partial [Chitinispirillaceae bacterium]|nr:AAA family ATPase [Chitinispirillaceae bacterium]
EIKVIDFGIAAELINERHFNSDLFEGTCLYIAPEQTGKINRRVDFRSDLYSTGVTLYEIFTGKPPFDGDELEVIHSHIAKIPLEPKNVCNEIPSTISDIIMKLLSKNAEDRYQTASGLKYDLEYCLENFYSRERILNFQIAQKDLSNSFEIPQKLYGREEDIGKLKDLLKSTDENSLRMLLISGYSGIGKTTIIQEISQEVICKGGQR